MSHRTTRGALDHTSIATENRPKSKFDTVKHKIERFSSIFSGVVRLPFSRHSVRMSIDVVWFPFLQSQLPTGNNTFTMADLVSPSATSTLAILRSRRPNMYWICEAVGSEKNKFSIEFDISPSRSAQSAVMESDSTDRISSSTRAAVTPQRKASSAYWRLHFHAPARLR